MYLAVERSFQPMQTYSSAGFQNPNCKFLSVDGTVDWLHADWLTSWSEQGRERQQNLPVMGQV